MYRGKYATPNFKPKDTARTAVVECQHTRPGSIAAASSKVTPGADTAARPRLQYTGTACLGVATLHKSNLVPVFSQDDAIATASMRR